MQDFMMGVVVFAIVVCVFAVLVVIVDLFRGRKADNKEVVVVAQPKEAVVVKESTEEVKAETVEEVKTEAAQEEKAAEPVSNDNTVFIAAAAFKTLEEKYADLSAESQAYYDEIARYAESKKEVTRHVKNDRYEEWKIGQAKLVRLLIKKDTVISEFNMQNLELKKHLSESNVSVKESATTIKVTNPEVVEVIKQSMDITIQLIAEEKKLKRAKKKQEVM